MLLMHSVVAWKARPPACRHERGCRSPSASLHQVWQVQIAGRAHGRADHKGPVHVLAKGHAQACPQEEVEVGCLQAQNHMHNAYVEELMCITMCAVQKVTRDHAAWGGCAAESGPCIEEPCLCMAAVHGWTPLACISSFSK